MPINVKIPTPLRGLTGDRDTVPGQGTTLGELVQHLEAEFPGMRERLCDDSGSLRRFVNVYVNGEDVRFLSGLDSALKEGDEVSIVPAVAGG
ncbi:MAG: MoaD/ThiS family protein [Dehalococcoidia bacterium]|nr:MoaD/ThiS family protein [Dehalococcoidia bacterium]HRC63016.1 MoaD/ThiS family protein [Dehalococcoidia bacterium]